MTRFRISALVLCLALNAGSLAAQKPLQTLHGPVALASTPRLAVHLEAFPRVQPGSAVTAPIAAKINASLARLDKSVAAAATDCAAQFRENQNRDSTDAWQRRITVSMRGPGFLSLVADDSFYCGGAYPDGGPMPLVYDLTTGRPVDWLKLLPPDAKGVSSTSADGMTVGLVRWGPLKAIALHDANAECKPLLREKDELDFALALDGRTGSIVATPFDLPHAVAACAVGIRLDARDARRLGVADTLTDALDAAVELQR